MRIVLAGNPNVGKSVFFGALTETYAEVSNFPGTTVELTRGKFSGGEVVDTPGVYSLSGTNEEERIAAAAVAEADLILNIADGTRLERDLFLTLQLLETGKPVILAVNMMDAAEKAGIFVDTKGLARDLGIPVIPCAARLGQGLDEVRAELEKALELLGSGTGTDSGTKTETENHSKTESAHRQTTYKSAAISHTAYRQRADKLTRRRQRKSGKAPAEGLDKFLLNPVFAYPLGILFLFGLYFFIGKFLAGTVVDFTQNKIMGTWYFNGITALLSPILSEGSLAESLLIGEYGVLTMVPIYLLGLLLPLVLGFQLVLSLLEDSGILPRIAVLADRSFSSVGLNGKAVIPLILGFGCTTMALISTRILGTKRERFIAAVILSIAVPCSAQFSIILALTTRLHPTYLLFYMILIHLAFAASGMLLNRILPGKPTDLFLSLPPLRVPDPKNILRKTLMKARHFLRDAGPLFLIGGLAISLLHHFNGFVVLKRWLAPVTVGILGLPEDTAGVFLMSLIKKDLGAAAFYNMVESGALTQVQITVTLVVMTLFVPCLASFLVLIKEEGFFRAVGIWIASLLAAFAAGAFTAAVL